MEARTPLVVLVALALLATPAALATHAGNHPGSKGNVDNRSPKANPPDVSGEDDDPGATGVQVHPNAGTSRTVSVTIDATDGNGHNDVDKAEVTLYKPDGTTVHNSVQNQQATKDSGSGAQATYSHSVDMNYYDPAGTYTIEVTVTDRDGSTSTDSSTFEYTELSAVSTNTSTVTLDDGSGSVDPDTDTHSSPTNVSIENAGNVPMDLSFSGTDLTDGNGNTINVTNVHLDTDEDNDFSTNEWTAKATTQTDTGFDLSASTDGTTSSKYVLFAIHVPNVPAGTYTGSLTLEAVKGS